MQQLELSSIDSNSSIFSLDIDNTEEQGDNNTSGVSYQELPVALHSKLMHSVSHAQHHSISTLATATGPSTVTTSPSQPANKICSLSQALSPKANGSQQRLRFDSQVVAESADNDFSNEQSFEMANLNAELLGLSPITGTRY
jgi:hypothetical protein